MSTTNTTHTIEISIENSQGEQFAAWLNAQGHSAKVGRGRAKAFENSRS